MSVIFLTGSRREAIFLTWRLWIAPGACRHGNQELRRTSGPASLSAQNFLDQTGFGPLWLKEPRSLKWLQRAFAWRLRVNQYAAIACVVMPNHVHLLIEPHVPVGHIMRGIKASASAANPCSTARA
jgi:hypothetical protein